MQAVKTNPTGMTPGAGDVRGCPAIQILKMMADDDPEAFLNAFEMSARAAGQLESQWTAILIRCFKEPTQ